MGPQPGNGLLYQISLKPLLGLSKVSTISQLFEVSIAIFIQVNFQLYNRDIIYSFNNLRMSTT